MVLAIHGWGGGAATFAPLESSIEGITLYCVDLPGYGGSSPLTKWSLEAVTTALVGFVETLPPGPITLLGNCSGALLGLLAANAIPKRFDRLVLIDPFAYRPWYFTLLTWPVLGRFFYNLSFANSMGRTLTNSSLVAHRTDETHLTQSFAELDHDVVYTYLLLVCSLAGISAFEPLKTHDITIVNGEHTFGAIRSSVKRWRAIWPQSKLEILSGAAHLPIQEATADLAALISDSKKLPNRAL